MNDLTEKFQIAKEQLNIQEVAEHYGLHIDRNKKALCPWHNDTHPSLSFKGTYGGYCHCFSCGSGGDVFALTGQLTGISKPVEVLKMLDRDFGLGIDLEQRKLTKSDLEKIRQREQTRQAKEHFSRWINYAFKICTDYAKLLRAWQIELAPHNGVEERSPSPLFVESMQELSYTEYLCTILTNGSEDDFKEFYKNYRMKVKAIAERLQQLNK